MTFIWPNNKFKSIFGYKLVYMTLIKDNLKVSSLASAQVTSAYPLIYRQFFSSTMFKPLTISFLLKIVFFEFIGPYYLWPEKSIELTRIIVLVYAVFKIIWPIYSIGGNCSPKPKYFDHAMVLLRRDNDPIQPIGD